MSVLFTVVAFFGFAYVVGHSKISLPFRQFLDPGETLKGFMDAARAFILLLLECPACLGFWCGLGYGWLTLHDVFGAVQWAFFICGANFILGRATKLI